MVTELVGWCLELGLRRRFLFYIGRPIFYTGGLVLALSCLTSGASIIMSDGNDDDEQEAWKRFQSAASANKLDLAFFLPEQLRSFVRFADAKSATANSILVMGSKISGDEKKRVAEALNCDVLESWGNTESLGTITDPEDLQTRPDSIGRPFLTDNGYFYFEGRTDESVHVGEKVVPLVTLESALRELPWIHDVCICVHYDGADAQLTVACTVTDLDRVNLGECEQRLQMPIHRIKTLEKLNIGPTGKVNRAEVQKQLDEPH